MGALSLNVDRQGLIPLLEKAVSIMFDNPKDVFWTGRAMDVLFDGMPIDCSSDDFNVQTLCTVFESGEIPQVQHVDEKNYKFSLFNYVKRTFQFGIFPALHFPCVRLLLLNFKNTF